MRGSLPDARTAPLIVAGLRTPLARAGTSLAGVEVQHLLAPVLRELVERTRVSAEAVAEVVVGNAAGGGGNLARLAALEAGLPASVPGFTVDRQCGSGLDAIVLACRLAQTGASRLLLAGGAESISTAPLRGRRAADGAIEFYSRARHAPPGDAGDGDPDMGVAAETVAREAGISRDRQDRFALRSHRRALAAAAAGRYDAELVPVTAGATSVNADNGPRARLDAPLLARFPAAFVPGGAVTAGNSCGDADGAAVVVVVGPGSSAALDSPRETALAFLDAETAGVDPRRLGLGGAAAVESLLGRHGLATTDLAAIEFNEAFAGQVLACMDRLGLDDAAIDRVLNTDGGSIALGHAYAASGAVSVVRLLARAQSLPEGSLCLAMISSAGGLGTAALFETCRVTPSTRRAV